MRADGLSARESTSLSCKDFGCRFKLEMAKSTPQKKKGTRVEYLLDPLQIIGDDSSAMALKRLKK